MRLRRLNLLVAGLTISFVTATAQADVLINIDKLAQQMTVTVDGVQRYVWPVSTGGRGYDTPSGEFTPFRMEKDHFSREWDDAPMPNSIFFTQIGHAIHGTFEGRNLGRPVSHGCVRLSRANATALFSLVKQEGMNHTRVVLSGHIPAHGAIPAVARRKPLNLNAPGYENRLSARGEQRQRDDSVYAPTYSADDAYDYRGSWPGYDRSQSPFPFPFPFGR